ncbi:matrixin family metalloprotease [Gottfriedia luciferensis]|uniref:matrixin family metalloprotease n=1 Tax=Gottfriedia luciferensis TaxID=178774 RepID=UPI000B43CA9E|nr:matrixin family metalloprotease [Gottfriedia luciferensis]
MKNFSTGLICLICVLLSFSIPIKTTYAYNTFGHKLVNGVGYYGQNRQYYFLNNSLGSEKQKFIDAMDKWIYGTITTPISFRETTAQSSSVIDVYKVSSPNNGVAALTYFMYGDKNVDASKTDWYWAKIDLQSGTYDKLTDWQKRLVHAHEIGHGLGLNHTNINGNLMHSNGNSSTTNIPQNDQFNGINSIYK